jgi:hypothetical protein
MGRPPGLCVESSRSCQVHASSLIRFRRSADACAQLHHENRNAAPVIGVAPSFISDNAPADYIPKIIVACSAFSFRRIDPSGLSISDTVLGPIFRRGGAHQVK